MFSTRGRTSLRSSSDATLMTIFRRDEIAMEQAFQETCQETSLADLYEKAAPDWLRDTPLVRDDLIAWPFILQKVKDLAAGGVVVDFGCGTGNISRLISSVVRTVVGLDDCREMIREAEDRTASGGNITYLEADMKTAAERLAKSSADLVLGAFAFCCLQDQRELVTAFRQARLLLKPGGHLLIQEPHPFAAFARKQSSWANDSGIPESYFETGVVVRRTLRTADGRSIAVGRHHFPLSVFLNSLIEAGFIIDEFVEPKPSDDLLKEFPDLLVEATTPSSFILTARVG